MIAFIDANRHRQPAGLRWGIVPICKVRQIAPSTYHAAKARQLIYAKGPWSGLSDVEFATLTYVDWFNNRRLHGQITAGPGDTTPAAHEAEYCQIVSATPAVTQPPRVTTKPGAVHTLFVVAEGRIVGIPIEGFVDRACGP